MPYDTHTFWITNSGRGRRCCRRSCGCGCGCRSCGCCRRSCGRGRGRGRGCSRGRGRGCSRGCGRRGRSCGCGGCCTWSHILKPLFLINSIIILASEFADLIFIMECGTTLALLTFDRTQKF